MKVLIIGATGFIGRQLAPELVSSGHGVVCLSRDKVNGRNILGPEIEILEWDGKSPVDLAQKIPDVEGIVNLAGESIAAGRWTTKRKSLLTSSRVDTGRKLAEAISLLREKPLFLLQGSATGYYGPVVKDETDESAGPGDGFLAGLTQKWESSALSVQEAGVRLVLMRTGIVLGKDGGMLRQLLGPFAFYSGTTPGSGKQYVSWIHMKDLVNAIRFLIDTPSLSGPVNLTSPEPVTLARMIAAIARQTGKPAWIKLPGFILKAAMGEMAAETILSDQRIIPGRLLKAGFIFNYPKLDPALRDLINS